MEGQRVIDEIAQLLRFRREGKDVDRLIDEAYGQLLPHLEEAERERLVREQEDEEGGKENGG